MVLMPDDRRDSMERLLDDLERAQWSAEEARAVAIRLTSTADAIARAHAPTTACGHPQVVRARKQVLGLVALVLFLGARTCRLAVTPQHASVTSTAATSTSLGELDEATCRWDWRLPGCAAAVPVGDGIGCALRPHANNWFRCRPVLLSESAAPTKRECPSHCQPIDSCTATAAAVLYKVAHGMRADCAVEGTCPPLSHQG